MKGHIEPLAKLIGAFSKLPGVGQKTAQRYALRVLDMNENDVKFFAEAVLQAKEKIKVCSTCGNYTDVDPCRICTDRKSSVVCVVRDYRDVLALEKLNDFDGVFHVLHGVLNPLENKGPNDINIKSLVKRVAEGNFKEVIVATNPDVEGEATAMYIAKILQPFDVKVTRPAQGISIGSDMEYQDEITLSRAMEDRKTI